MAYEAECAVERKWESRTERDVTDMYSAAIKCEAKKEEDEELYGGRSLGATSMIDAYATHITT
jgi:hypothetical protein